MTRNLLTKLDKSILLENCDQKDLDMVTATKIKPVIIKYQSNFASKGTLVSQLEHAQDILPIYGPNGHKLYSLAPINLLLWLHILGLGEVRKGEFFSSLAEECQRLFKYWAGKGGRRITLEKAPISRTMRELIANPKEFLKRENRSFLHLQALIAALCCGVRDAEVPEVELCRNALLACAPRATRMFTPITVGQRELYICSAAYTDNNNAWNCGLFQVVKAWELAMYMRTLCAEASETLAKRSRMGTRTISRDEFFVKLYSYAELSLSADPIDCRRWIVLAGNRLLW